MGWEKADGCSNCVRILGGFSCRLKASAVGTFERYGIPNLRESLTNVSKVSGDWETGGSIVPEVFPSSVGRP